MKLPLADHQKILVPIADTDFIVESVLPADGPLTLANSELTPTRNVTIEVTTATITAGLVTVTGINFVTGLVDTEVLDLSVATSLTGTKVFSSISSVVISNLAGEDPADTIIVGVGQIAQITVGRTTFISIIVGVELTGGVKIIDGITGTTENVAFLANPYLPGNYDFDASISEGLRVLPSDQAVTIIYNQ